MCIRVEDFDVPMLTCQDLEVDLPSCSVNSLYPSQVLHTSLHDKTIATQLAEVFIANLELCMIVGSILSSRYSALGRPLESSRLDGSSLQTVILYPTTDSTSDRTRSEHRGQNLSLLDTELARFCDDLPDSARINKPDDKASAVVVQCGFLHLHYHTAISALHRSRNKSPQSAVRLSKAYTNIASICAYLNTRGLSRYMPITALVFLMPSIMVHSLRVKSAALKARRNHRPDTKEARGTIKARDSVNELLISFVGLRDIYMGEENVLMIVENFFHAAKLRMITTPPNAGDFSKLPSTTRRFEIELGEVDSTSPSSNPREASHGEPRTLDSVHQSHSSMPKQHPRGGEETNRAPLSVSPLEPDSIFNGSVDTALINGFGQQDSFDVLEREENYDANHSFGEPAWNDILNDTAYSDAICELDTWNMNMAGIAMGGEFDTGEDDVEIWGTMLDRLPRSSDD